MATDPASPHALARQVAAITGESTDEAVRIALAERLARLNASPAETLGRRLVLIGGDVRKKYDVREAITPKDRDDI